MTLTKEQQLGYLEIELRVLFQRAIEVMDEINHVSDELKIQSNDFKTNIKLKAQLKGVYGPLDKQTRRYNDIYEASEEGTTVFYNITKANTELVMHHNLLDKSIICQALAAHEKNPKAVEGIFAKILKSN